jgi:hypothetical protein
MSATLFLDVDGVLNSTRYWWKCDRDLPLGQAGAIDPAAVERLNRIIDATGCDVVLSSSWRGNGSKRQLLRVEAMLRERGYRHGLCGATPHLWEDRHVEIADWLDRYPPVRFIVLDDDLDAWTDSFADRGGLFVNTNYLVGLQDDGVAMAVAWLRQEVPA